MAMDNITLTSGMRQNLFSLQQTAKSMDITQTIFPLLEQGDSAGVDESQFWFQWKYLEERRQSSFGGGTVHRIGPVASER